MSNYVIAIPTYNRENVIADKTLTTLLYGGISKNKIYIFVANKAQAQLYKDAVPKSHYNEIIVGKIGIANQRQYISKYFPLNQYIVSLDDDIEEVQMLKGDKLVKFNNLDVLFKHAYTLLKQENIYIW